MPTISPSRVMLATTSWKRYVAIVEALGEANPGLRVAYDDETMEIMSPSFEQERIVRTFDGDALRAASLANGGYVAADRGINLPWLPLDDIAARADKCTC